MTQLRLDWRTAERQAIRDGAREGFRRIGEDERVVVLSGDLAASVRVDQFAKEHPNRFFEMGVQEQNMVGVAAGMASVGYIPFVASYPVFLSRGWEQVRSSIALSNLNVKLLGSHGGASVGKNGPTHQALEDIAIFRVLPKMVVLAPADSNQMAGAIEAAHKHEGPVYIRGAREKSCQLGREGEDFVIGKIYRYREGKDLTIAASGMMVEKALMIADKLEMEGVEIEVLNVSTIKPLDVETLVESVKKTGKVITIEDHQIMGGMGSAVVEALSKEYPVAVTRLGVDDRWGVSGESDEVYREMGLDLVNLEKRVRAVLNS